MFHNIDSLWNAIEQRITSKDLNYKGGSKKTNYIIRDRSKSKSDNMHFYQFSYADSNSVKKVMVKNILKQGVLYELKTLIDSLSGPSHFVTEFYNSFTPKDTLLGKAVLEDKTRMFFKALRDKDSIVLESYDLIKFAPKHSKLIVDALKNHEFDKGRLHIKNHLLKELIKIDSKKHISFIKELYYSNYSNPVIQTGILEALLDSNNSSNYSIVLELMERDLPLANVSQIFYNYRKDSLELKASLFPKILQYSTIKEYKQPLYNLLARVKDSGYVNTKHLSNYKNQIINDGKIEVKRSLSNTHSKYEYNSYKTSKALTTYVSLIFPYRKERSAKDFFEKLLTVDDKHALVKYYTLLAKHNEAIPEILKEKVLHNEDNQYLSIEGLDHANLLKTLQKNPITQKQYAKSKLLSQARISEEKDSISFIKSQDFITDKGQPADIYFFKINKKDEYLGNTEELHYMAFLKSKDKSLVVKPYYISNNAGLTIDETKSLQEQLTEVVNLATFKNRKRLKPLRNRGYYNY